METRKTPGLGDPLFYKRATSELWTGRVDGYREDQLRWHQVVDYLDITGEINGSQTGGTAFLGFSSDAGVRRNKGRTGAAGGPRDIRHACANLPAFRGLRISDAGDILCPGDHLEEAQAYLAEAVCKLLNAGMFPVLLGGGHEITYGHFRGIQQAFPGEEIGVINLDAHFDLRKPGPEGPSSGTGFYQIAEDVKASAHGFKYLALGIQRAANTAELFERARQSGVSWLLDRDLEQLPAEAIASHIEAFMSEVDRIYLTVDLDVFSAAYCPGVSAQNPRGLIPGVTCDRILQTVVRSGKLTSVDVAEYNPAMDLDSRTAKLAASLIYDLLNPGFPVGSYDPGRH